MSTEQPSLFPVPSRVDGSSLSVSLYHDSSNEPFHAHGCLVVPTQSRTALLTALKDARSRWNCETKLHFNEFSGQKWGPPERCANHWIKLGVEALRHKGATQPFSSPLLCKLGVILFDKKSHVELERFSGDVRERRVRWSETLIRILLTGVIRFCYDTEQSLTIEGIVTDSEPYHRLLSEYRILERLKERLGPLITIAPGAHIRHILSDHRDSRCASQDDAHLLQLVDLLLGSVVSHSADLHRTGSKKEQLRHAVSDMLAKQLRGSGFAASGHYRSYSIFQARIEDEEWTFASVPVASLKTTARQLLLISER
ncbi:MAG: hypothetical protein LAN61_00100 [Acidobacteriia bacterium]|nr:hypothetical protein [Terriglobia bacterium]